MISHLISIYKKFRHHPLTKNSIITALSRYISWQLYAYFKKSDKLVSGYNGITIRLNKNSPSINALYYFGLSDYEEMSFLLQFLRSDHQFIDVGANHGAYTLLAQNIGAKIIAFEPNPLAMERLKSNLLLNGDNCNIQFRSIALGETPGFLTMTEEYGQQNHIVESVANALLVPVNTLDNEISFLNSASMIKIDVEGYELNVLKGGRIILDNPMVKAVIVEMMEMGKRYGSSDIQVHEFLLFKGFKPYKYNPTSFDLDLQTVIQQGNGLYIRDLEFVKSQLIRPRS